MTGPALRNRRRSGDGRGETLDGISPSGVSTEEAAWLAGLSYRQLDYWVRTGVFARPTPGHEWFRGSGTKRRFKVDDVRLIRTLAGVSELSGTDTTMFRRVRELLETRPDARWVVLTREGASVVSDELDLAAAALQPVVIVPVA